MDESQEAEEVSYEDPNEIYAEYIKTIERKEFLRDTIKYLKEEKSHITQKENRLDEQLATMTSLLEKNVQIYHELYDGSLNALHMCRSLWQNPISKEVKEKSVQMSRQIINRPITSSPKAGPSDISPIPISGVNARRRRPIESEPIETGENLTERANISNRLTTILEESARRLTIRLERLPSHVVERHQSSTNEATSSFMERSLSQVEVMNQLGLTPTTPLRQVTPKGIFNNCALFRSPVASNNFVTTKRRRHALSYSPKTPFSEKPVKKEQISGKRKTVANVEENAATGSGRPKRKARPTALKEASLKDKKRRN